MKTASAQWAESIGRKMAQSDMEKSAQAEELTVEVMGLVKEAKTLDLLTSIAKKNPGALIGGGLGLLHGLTKDDGGLGSGLMEAGVGAAAGHGVQHAGRAAMAHPKVAPHVEALKAKLPLNKPSAPASMTNEDVLPKMASSFGDELWKIAQHDKTAFGAALAGLARAIPGAVSKLAPAAGKWLSQPGNLMKGGLFAAQTVGSGLANKQQGGSFLGGAASGALSSAGTLAPG